MAAYLCLKHSSGIFPSFSIEDAEAGQRMLKKSNNFNLSHFRHIAAL
ncbi:hypothetical protein ADINL_2710 [Nitrincola lacisaponensis]|uniref:Uncharacterized protein n=1 Tax=Nitrincola lacisaponensis TaxID=267850 RepID=A0A063XZA1_9GAMM|nr:hypothetical protein ADINL_2710 [Nitrincola lacisaponensis]